MAQTWGEGFWKLGQVSFLVVGGAIATKGDCVLAQVTPDATLGAESSVVAPQAPGSPVDVIQGGATRGANLFHSFEQFSIPTGGEAFFNNAADIQNIISRVTGLSISNIDGLIRANGTANLFLLNPNGIAFGSNAALNIGGSFIGSTASSLNFADGTNFSATAHPTTPLLTVSVPIGLQYGGNAGSVQVQGNGQGTRSTTDLIDTTVGLRVEPNQTLALVGGNVALSGGTLKTAGGRIELGSVAGAGLVNLMPTNTGWTLGYEGVPTFGDIQLSGQATVDASGAGGGDIQVQGRQVTLTNGSQIEASTLGAEPGGTLSVNASDSVELIGTSVDGWFVSGLFTQVYPGATGAAGNLTLETGRLLVSDGAQVSAGTDGTGAGGTLSVTASDAVEVIGTSADGQFNSGLRAYTRGEGDSGDLTIATGRLLVSDGAKVSASTSGTGAGGTLSVTASDAVEVIGTSADGYSFSDLRAFAEDKGDAGDLTIATGRLLVSDGAQVSASTFGTGAGGTLSVTASDAVEVIGTSADGYFSSGLSVYTGDQGGDSGDLTIATGRLLVSDGAQVTATTFGTGAGGTLSVTASDAVEVIGTSANGQFGSALCAYTADAGNSGELTIATGRLLVSDGAQVSASTFGTGDGGTLSVNAFDSVQLTGTSFDGEFPSVLSANTEVIGNAGDLTINTPTLRVQDGAQVSVSTRGEGSAGTADINALSVEVSGSGSGLFNRTGSTGDAGTLKITAEELTVQNEAQVSVDNFIPTGFRIEERLNQSGNPVTIIVPIIEPREGSGNAGDLEITADSIRLEGGGRITADSSGGNGGNIELQVEDLLLLDNSNISTTAGTLEAPGNGGSIDIDTDNLVALENSDIIANAFQGLGGRVEVAAQGIFGIEFRERENPATSDITATGGRPELSGTVEINNPDVDPSQGLIELPAELVDVSNQIATDCPASVRRGESKFIITGRGGLPPNPREPLNGDNGLTEWNTLDSDTENRSSAAPSSTNSTKESAPTQIVEANGWTINDKGEVVLTATAPSSTLDIPWVPKSGCNAPEPKS